MQEITRIVAMAIVMTVLLTYLRSASQTALASQLAIGFMVMLLFLILPSLQQVIRVFADLGKRAQIRNIYMAVVLKAVGTAYVAALGAQLAKDAKEETAATVVEMAGKVLIMLLAVPLVASIMDALVGLMP
jgi:stage III sporulation protein AD